MGKAPRRPSPLASQGTKPAAGGLDATDIHHNGAKSRWHHRGLNFTDDVRLGYFDRRRGFLERSFLNEENAQPGVVLILDYPLDERLMVHGRQAA